MKYLKIKPNCTTDGEGIRVSLYVSGCDINCEGCHNPESHNPDNGTLYTSDTETEILSLLEPSWISGLTICGGEPSMSYNFPELTNLVRKVRTLLPSKTIWIYTGRSWDQVKELELFKLCDIAITEPFILKLRDVSHNNQWRGSTNQKIINIKGS